MDHCSFMVKFNLYPPSKLDWNSHRRLTVCGCDDNFCGVTVNYGWVEGQCPVVHSCSLHYVLYVLGGDVTDTIWEGQWPLREGELFKIICEWTKSGYTREKICNLNHHCNDDCNSSLEWSDLTHERKFVIWMIIAMMIVIRLKNANSREERVCVKINTCAHKSKGHVSLASQKMIWTFLRTHAEFAL